MALVDEMWIKNWIKNGIKHDKPRIGNQENRAPIREAVVFQRRQTVGISRYPRGDPGGKK